MCSSSPGLFRGCSGAALDLKTGENNFFYEFTDLRGNWEGGGGADTDLRIKTSPAAHFEIIGHWISQESRNSPWAISAAIALADATSMSHAAAALSWRLSLGAT